MTVDDLLEGLQAQVKADCRVLVLGSMPGGMSLRQAQYYAHPRNRFWPLMAALFGVDAQAPYAARMLSLQRAGVGLWDVIARCRRRGSLDAAIVRGSEVLNPVGPLIAGLPALRLVACNGAAAHRAFQRFIAASLPAGTGVAVLGLPSTSPANAACSLQALWQAWQPVAAAAIPDRHDAAAPSRGGPAAEAREHRAGQGSGPCAD